MKTFICILIISILSVILFACGDGSTQSDNKNDNNIISEKNHEVFPIELTAYNESLILSGYIIMCAVI